MDIDYFGLLKKSWKDFLNNKILFIPILYSILIGILFLVVVGAELLIFFVIPGALLKWFFASIAVLADIILIGVMAAYFGSIFLSMLKEIVDTGKTSANSMHKRGLKFLSKIFWIAFYRFIYIAVLPGLLTAIGIFVLSSLMPLAIFLFILAGLYLIAAVILIYFGTFFASPIITSEQGTAWQLFVQSINYTKNNLRTVLLSWLVVFLLSAVVGIILFMIGLPFSIMSYGIEAFKPGASLAMIPFKLILGFFQTVVRLILGFVTGLFIFNVYFTAIKKKPKAKKVKKK